MRSDSIPYAFAAAAMLLLMPTIQHAAPPRFALDTVVLSGEAAPDGNGRYEIFSSPILNDAGQVVFLTFLSDTAGDLHDDMGMYRGDTKSAPQRVVREGQSAPDGNGLFSMTTHPLSAHYLTLNSRGQVAFRVGLTDTIDGINDNRGVFRWDGENEIVTIARRGETVADHPVIGSFEGGQSTAFFPPDLNDSGQVAFLSQFPSPDDPWSFRLGMVIGDGTHPLAVTAYTGQVTPDGSSQIAQLYAAVGPVINKSGQVAAYSETTASSSGIFRGNGLDEFVQVARPGQGILGSDETLERFDSAEDIISLNDAGQVAFAGATNGSALGASGIFVSDGPGDLTQIVAANQSAPDGNGVFSRFDPFRQINPISLNNAGQVVFESELSNTSNGLYTRTGLFLGSGNDDLVQIARGDQAAPGGDGVLFQMSSVHLNDAGQVAFEAWIDTTASGTRNENAIYLYDEAYGLLEVAREGQSYLGSPLTDVALLELSPSTIGRPAGQNRSALNEAGQIAFRFSLADGRSGIAIASVVPEPGMLGMMIFSALPILLRNRRVGPPRT